MIPLTVAVAAVDVVLKTTYEIDSSGHRVCRRCEVMQYDYPTGHAPDCEIAGALAEALKILEGK